MVINGKTDSTTNTRFPSATSVGGISRLSTAPAGDRQRGAAAPPKSRRKQRRAFRKVQIVVEYRGGPNCSYLVSADGRSWRYEGCLALHDVMSHFWNQVH